MVKMTVNLIGLSILAVSLLHCCSGLKIACPCTNGHLCSNVNTWASNKNEVVVTTNHDSNFTKWMWDSITTVLEEDDVAGNSELMCYAHSQNSKYGHFVNVPPQTMGNETKLQEFITHVQYEARHRFADVLAFDFIDLVGNCGYSQSHSQQILHVISTLINQTKQQIPYITALCVMPWKPPCYENNCGLSFSLVPYCDAVMTSPESYSTFCDMACIARATVPYTKLIMGIDEWLSTGFTPEKLVIGIPWHGYKYTCESYQAVPGNGMPYCRLKEKKDPVTNVTSCDVKNSREKLVLETFFAEHPSYEFDKFGSGEQAPFFRTKASDGSNKTAIAWYENFGSLLEKYEAARKYKLKGVVIYTGEDLTYTKISSGTSHLNQEMWSWLLHSILATGEETKQEKKFNYIGTIAGVSIGTFLLGAVLGFIITCMACRRPNKLRVPFHGDRLDDEFHDDDNAL